MKIAVASKDKRIVNQHFGHADRFLIYEVADGKIDLIDERSVMAFCTDEDDLYAKNRIERSYEVMNDCEYLLCSMIGLKPQTELQDRGLKIMTTYDLIENAITSIMNITQTV